MSAETMPAALGSDWSDRSVEGDFDTSAVHAGIVGLELALGDEQSFRKIDLTVDARDGDFEITEIVLVASGELDDAGTVLAEAVEEFLDLNCTGHSRTLSGVTR